jgi:hypothetical protein
LQYIAILLFNALDTRSVKSKPVIPKTMSFRSAMIRIPVSKLAAGTQSRMLSGQGNMAVTKLQQVFEEYRVTK